MKWRLHWLELRLRELAYQRARHEEAYAQLCGATTDAEATTDAGSQPEAAAANQTPSPAGAAHGLSRLPTCLLTMQRAVVSHVTILGDCLQELEFRRSGPLKYPDRQHSSCTHPPIGLNSKPYRQRFLRLQP